MNISRTLAEFIYETSYYFLHIDFCRSANMRILDLFSAALAGKKVNPYMNKAVLDTLVSQGGDEQSSMWFSGKKLSASQAAMYNAFVASGAEMDDGNMIANGHPGITTIPAVLALAQWKKLPYEDIITSIAVGYDIYIRISNAVLPSHLNRGFYGTGTVGTIAAAAASAKVLGLEPDRIHTALGLAAASAAGFMEFNETGQEMKPINPANANYKGVICALLAANGAVSPEAPLDGKRGFFKAFADEVNVDRILDDLGQDYLMESSYIKLYPACRHLHAMVDCGVLTREDERFDIDRVKKISLYTYPNSEKLTGKIIHPQSSTDRKFSLTYASAMALVYGNYTLEDLDTANEISPVVTDLIDKMEIIVDPELEIREKHIRGARMETTLDDGTVIVKAVDVPKGEPALPVADQDIIRKLKSCASGVIPEEEADQLYTIMKDADTLDKIMDCVNILSKER